MVSYSLEGAGLISDRELTPRIFVEEALGLGLPRDVKELLSSRELIELVESALRGAGMEAVQLEGMRLGPPLPNPRKR